MKLKEILHAIATVLFFFMLTVSFIVALTMLVSLVETLLGNPSGISDWFRGIFVFALSCAGSFLGFRLSEKTDRI